MTFSPRFLRNRVDRPVPQPKSSAREPWLWRPNQARQIAKREIVRSRKLKRRICARPFLIFIHVAERVIHRKTFAVAHENQPKLFVTPIWCACADIEKGNTLPRALNRPCGRYCGRMAIEFSPNCAFQSRNLEPDPKIGSSGDRSWPGTAGLFPIVPACSTASGSAMIVWVVDEGRLLLSRA